MGKNASDDIATALSFYVLVLNFTNMFAMSDRSDIFLACSSKVNIQEPAFYLTIMYRLTVTQVEIPRYPVPTTMSYSKCLNTSLLEVMISSKNEHVFDHNLSEVISQIIFDACGL